MSALPKSLIDAVRNRTLIPFVGAGVSVGAVSHLNAEYKFPNWPDLIRILAKRLVEEAQPVPAQQVLDALPADSMKAAQLAMDALGRNRFAREMEQLFRRECPRGAELSAIGAIWRLRAPFVVTTNYDSVLGWLPATHNIEIVHNDEPTPLGRLELPNEPSRVWHLHGSAQRIDTVILTALQYTKLYPKLDDPKRVEYQNAYDRFRNLLATRPFLFIGYSLDEPILREKLEELREVTVQTTPTKFLLLRAGQADDAKKAVLAQLGVQVIEYADFGAPLVALLDEIGREAWGNTIEHVGPLPTRVMKPFIDSLEVLLREVVVSSEDVARLFNRARPSGWPAAVPGSDRVTQLTVAARALAIAVTPEAGVHPLLAFVDDLRDVLFEPQKGKVSGWLEHAIDELAPNAGRAREIGAALAQRKVLAAQTGAHILVRIVEPPSVPRKWCIHAWAFAGEEPEAFFEPQGREVDADDTGEVVVAITEMLQARQFLPSATTIAFVVPLPIACGSLDQWELPREIANDKPLGDSHVVVVRPLDRLQKHRIVRQRYKQGWSSLLAQAKVAFRLVAEGAPPPPDAVSGMCVDTVTACGNSLESVLSKSGVRCVVLKQAPSPEALAHLKAVLETSVPVVLWYRNGAAPFDAVVEPALRDLLEQGELLDLPERLRDYRAAQPAIADAPGRQVTLLWDNADYLPPDMAPGARVSILTN